VAAFHESFALLAGLTLAACAAAWQMRAPAATAPRPVAPS
jgi:hypothetical protein